ncbi:paraquat-inducible protein A [Peteryoungia algae]|uniref:Paraquat-inducible protein A n=1 Tax=Peteryoungia algae TaxID=2919917 RepID=A0ABT0CZH7_9HYPH|nr:paraquat-inducible protein A [Rhizobium sp. SSM4.3]MCJ8238364.1 paraquat-inducible protein A [Rhizobium sp. SSM4.3]
MLIWLKAFLLIGASISFALGITLPLMRFESFYVFSTDASLIEVVVSLWDGGDGALAVLVALVSVVFPLVKILLVAAEEIAGSQPARPDALARLLPALSKWSMMDVLLVAIVIFATKTSGLAEAFTQPGLWFYAGSSLAVAALSALGRRGGIQKT